MYIKEICLEGFKSYATRTVISGFDPYFNAITGLNGSGKSNILDSICFVLGITNLQQVRAENLQQLVYKQGQSGISKATVSINFDNLEIKRSPLGYEDCSYITVSRQVIGGERNKYLINGRVVQLKQVQNMFHYVQLNINNPHFIIMQGRITKVMNMKPPEILYMLEEAAGTRLYETKKEDALKTIEKKQHKIDEINRLLDEEILPALEKMENEKMQYMKWVRGNEELERLRRFCIAYTFFQAEKTRDTALTGAEQTRIKISEIYNDAKRMQGEIQDLQSKISKLTSEEDMTMAGEISSLLEKVDGLSSDFVKENTVLTNQQDSLRSEEEYADKVATSIQDIEKSIQEMNFYVLKAEEREADLKKRVEEHSKNLEEHEKEYQGVLAGKSSGNEKKCLEDQLADAKAATGSALTQLEQLKTKMSHYDKELKEKKEQLLSKCEEAIAVEKELSIRRGDVEDTEIALKSVPYEEGQVEALQKDRMLEFEAMQRLRDEIRNLSAQLANVHFTYRDPVNRFDRLKVKGVVAKLINVKDGSRMTALEVAAGAKLFNIVVDTEKTATQLIQNGDLRSRVTIIPLNKIQPDIVTPIIQNAAVRLVGDGNAELALCLVTYDEEVEDAVKYVFGSTFVCTTIDVAKEVAFSKDIHTPSVTLEGDIFEPSGVLTGGCRKGGGELLRRLQMLSEFESKFSFHEKRLSEIDSQLSRLLPLQKKLMELKSQLELQSYELELFQSRAQQSEHHKLGELVKKIEKDLEEAKLEEKEKELLYSNSLSVVHALQKSITEHANNRESRLVELEKKIQTTMNHMQLALEDLKGHANDRTKLIMEIEAVSQERASLEKHLSSLETLIHNIRAEVDKRSCKVNAIKKDNDRAQDELKLIWLKMKARDSEINSLVKEEENLQHTLSNSIIERKMLENELNRLEIKQKDCSLTVVKLLQKHSWIASEKNLFGRSGSDYDFSTCNPHRASEELEILQSEQSILEKRVNKKVIAMLEKAQDECNGLMSRKRIIESDKLKIETVIKELDEKKNKTLEITFLKVNKDFGSIFSTLLPGTMAKLEPPEGCNFLNGLEVHVAFGSVWKQSLSELSGGQRSLLTLSLILALLLFKPAPLYILDEVDSALDMSHTQNVGQMIKHHFPHSQFIVVSHKEGMFNNANVLFKTQFLDGVSTVTRTVTSKPSS